MLKVLIGTTELITFFDELGVLVEDCVDIVFPDFLVVLGSALDEGELLVHPFGLAGELLVHKFVLRITCWG